MGVAKCTARPPKIGGATSSARATPTRDHIANVTGTQAAAKTPFATAGLVSLLPMTNQTVVSAQAQAVEALLGATAMDQVWCRAVQAWMAGSSPAMTNVDWG